MQDTFGKKVEGGDWKELGGWPEELKWKALGDVSQGRVRVSLKFFKII